MIEFQDSKTLLVDANREDSYFFAWELKDKTVMNIEIQPSDCPSKSIYHYKDIENFVDGTEWYEWIKEGIKDERIKHE